MLNAEFFLPAGYVSRLHMQTTDRQALMVIYTESTGSRYEVEYHARTRRNYGEEWSLEEQPRQQ